MKIETIMLQDFKCFENLDIRFTKPVNLIFGENASGKTTIAQAITLALTGRINGSSERVSLTRHEAEGFAVTVSLSQNGTGPLRHYELTQLASAKKSADPEKLFEGLKTNRETLTALLETGNFLDLHPDEKKRLLFDLLPDLKVDADNLTRHLAAWLREQPELLQKHRIDSPENLLEVLSAPASLEDAYTQAYDERRFVRRELKTLGDCPRIPQDLTIEKLEESLDRKRDELSALHVAIGETKGMAEGERKQIERELAHVLDQLQQLESFLLDADPEALREQLDEGEGRRLTLIGEIQAFKEDYAALQRETGKLLAKKEQEEKGRAKAKTFNGRCPVFPEVACKTREVIARIKADVSDGTELAAALEIQTGKTNDVLRLLQEKEEALNRVNGGMMTIKANLNRLTDGERKREEMQAKKHELENILSSVAEEKTATAQELKEKIAVLEGEIRQETGLLADLEKAERIQALEAQAAELEVLTQAFSPKGIMSRLMQGAATSLTTLANGLMADLTGSRYALEIAFEEGFQIYLIDYEKSARTEIRLVSASERFRVGIILQAVLSELAGLRFLVIDGIDVLDQANRGFFFQFLQKALPRFDQIIGFCTTGQFAPKNPGLPEMDFFLLADRQLKRITA